MNVEPVASVTSHPLNVLIHKVASTASAKKALPVVWNADLLEIWDCLPVAFLMNL